MVIMKKAHTKKGIATLEVLIAFAFFAIIMTSATLVSFGGQTANLDADLTHHGMLAAASTFGENVANAIAGVSTFANAESYDIYTLTETISLATDCIKEVGTEASWETEKSRTQGISYRTLIADKEAAIASGSSDCKEPSGGWDNPDSEGDITISPEGVHGTSLDSAPKGASKYVILGTEHSDPSKPDLFVIDATIATDPDNPPFVVASLDTGRRGINDLVVVKNYAYVLDQKETGGTGRILVVDLSKSIDPNNSDFQSDPEIVNEISLEDCCEIDPDGLNPEGWRIAYRDGYIYIGLKRTIGSEFLIFDVGSDPEEPSLTGKLDEDFLHNVNDIAISEDGDYAYLASSSDSREVIIIDISNKNNPIDTGVGADLLGTVDATSITRLNTTLYVGRKYTTSTTPNFYIVGIGKDDPADLDILGSKKVPLKNNTQVEGIEVALPYAFLATSDSTSGLQIWEVDDPSNIKPHNGCSVFNYSEHARALIFTDNLVFTANESNDALRVIYDKKFCDE